MPSGSLHKALAKVVQELNEERDQALKGASSELARQQIRQDYMKRTRAALDQTVKERSSRV